MFDNRALRRTFGTKRAEVVEAGEGYTLKSVTTCNLHQILLG
jgi:hypothetical protein